MYNVYFPCYIFPISSPETLNSTVGKEVSSFVSLIARKYTGEHTLIEDRVKDFFLCSSCAISFMV